MTFKRLIAYIIDLLIIFLFIFLLKNILVGNQVETLEKSLSMITEYFLNNTIAFRDYIKQAAPLTVEIDKYSILVNLINFAFISIFVIIIPYFYSGSTIGCKIMKIKIEASDNKLTMKKLIIRSVILYGFLHLIILIPLLYILPPVSYYIIINVLSFIQILLVIISGFMVLYRKDKLGLQDILSSTHIENERGI